MEFTVYGENYAKILAINSAKLFHLHCYRQVASIFTFFFRLLRQSPNIELPLLNRKEKLTYDKCATQITKLNLARHKKSSSAGTLH